MRVVFIILVIFLFTKSFSVNSQVLETVDLTYDDGDRYIGEVLNNKKHGTGTYISKSWPSQKGGPNGGEYKGEWKNDKMHGEGVIRLNDGSVLSASPL